MAIVAIPSAAVLVAVKVNVLFVVAEAGLNVAVTPPGTPLALKATLPLKMPMGVMVTLVDPVPPCTMVGESADKEKSFNGVCTVKLIEVVWLKLPLVPVIVTWDEMSEALLDAEKVTMLNEPVVEAGLNDAVTPLGKLLALKVTLPAKPPVWPILMVAVALPP